MTTNQYNSIPTDSTSTGSWRNWTNGSSSVFSTGGNGPMGPSSCPPLMGPSSVPLMGCSNVLIGSTDQLNKTSSSDLKQNPNSITQYIAYQELEKYLKDNLTPRNDDDYTYHPNIKFCFNDIPVINIDININICGLFKQDVKVYMDGDDGHIFEYEGSTWKSADKKLFVDEIRNRVEFTYRKLSIENSLPKNILELMNKLVKDKKTLFSGTVKFPYASHFLTLENKSFGRIVISFTQTDSKITLKYIDANLEYLSIDGNKVPILDKTKAMFTKSSYELLSKLVDRILNEKAFPTEIIEQVLPYLPYSNSNYSICLCDNSSIKITPKTGGCSLEYVFNDKKIVTEIIKIDAIKYAAHLEFEGSLKNVEESNNRGIKYIVSLICNPDNVEGSIFTNIKKYIN